MIEPLLQAERALSVGLVDQAERLYRQVADNDPRNAIAVVGLARVALERSDDATAYREVRRALTIDPENVAARRLVVRLEEVYAYRGQPLPSVRPDAAPGIPARQAPRAAQGLPEEPVRPPSAAQPVQPPLAAPPAVAPVPRPAVAETPRPPATEAPRPAGTEAPPVAEREIGTQQAPPSDAAAPPSQPGSPPPSPAPVPSPAGSPTSRPKPSSPSLLDRLLRRKRP